MKYELKKWFKEVIFCIVDEVDSILIDESRTPLIISGKLEDKLHSQSQMNLKHLQLVIMN